MRYFWCTQINAQYFLCDKVTNVINSYLFAFLNADECKNTCADPEKSVRVIVVGCVCVCGGGGGVMATISSVINAFHRRS